MGKLKLLPILFFFGYQNRQGWDKAPYHCHAFSRQVMGGTIVPPPPHFFPLQLGISKRKNKTPYHCCGHCASIGGDSTSSPPPPPILFHFFNILIFRTNGTRERNSLSSPCSSPCSNVGVSIPFFFFLKAQIGKFHSPPLPCMVVLQQWGKLQFPFFFFVLCGCLQSRWAWEQKSLSLS